MRTEQEIRDRIEAVASKYYFETKKNRAKESYAYRIALENLRWVVE
jgi:hypothetical protein